MSQKVLAAKRKSLVQKAGKDSRPSPTSAVTDGEENKLFKSNINIILLNVERRHDRGKKITIDNHSNQRFTQQELKDVPQNLQAFPNCENEAAKFTMYLLQLDMAVVARTVKYLWYINATLSKNQIGN